MQLLYPKAKPWMMFTAVPNLQACANSWAVNLDANDIWSYWSVTYVISFTHLSPFQKRKDEHFCEDTRVGTKVWEVKYSVTRPMIKPPTQPMVAQIKASQGRKHQPGTWKLTWNRVEPDVFPLGPCPGSNVSSWGAAGLRIFCNVRAMLACYVKRTSIQKSD